MLEDAIAKIKSEMAENKNSAYVKVIGDFLLQHLEMHPVVSEKILTEGKTIKGSIGEMRKAAERNKVDNCAVLTDAEGFAVVLKYFGVETAHAPTYVPVGAPSQSTDFDVKLDDFL